MNQYSPKDFDRTKVTPFVPGKKPPVEHLFEPRKRGYPTRSCCTLGSGDETPRSGLGKRLSEKAVAFGHRPPPKPIPIYTKNIIELRATFKQIIRLKPKLPSEAAKARRVREIAAVEAAMLEQLALERMPRSRIAEITRQRGKIAPVRAKATDLFAAFDAAAASDEREQNSPENILKAKKPEFGRQVRAPWLPIHVDFEGRGLPLKSPREDYKDFSADPPVWWINGLPVPKKPTAPKATKICSGDAGAPRIPAEKRTEKDEAIGTDKTVRERIKEIVAFD
jgi:hypothetical protein